MSYLMNLMNSTGYVPDYQPDDPPLLEVALASTALIGLLFLNLTKARPANAHPNSDMPAILRISEEIVKLETTIGDAASYEFSKKKGQYINENNTKDGTLATMSAFGGGLKGVMNGGSLKPSELKNSGATYAKSAEEILKLGQSLLATRSGQCDHMAASVIAKIVEVIQKGGAWNSRVEIVGNGGHAFVIIGRKEGSQLNSPKTWSENACIVDTWLATVGVSDEYASRLPSGKFGVLTERKEFYSYRRFFGDFSTTHDFSPAELRKLANPT